MKGIAEYMLFCIFVKKQGSKLFSSIGRVKIFSSKSRKIFVKKQPHRRGRGGRGGRKPSSLGHSWRPSCEEVSDCPSRYKACRYGSCYYTHIPAAMVNWLKERASKEKAQICGWSTFTLLKLTQTRRTPWLGRGQVILRQVWNHKRLSFKLENASGVALAAGVLSISHAKCLPSPMVSHLLSKLRANSTLYIFFKIILSLQLSTLSQAGWCSLFKRGRKIRLFANVYVEKTCLQKSVVFKLFCGRNISKHAKTLLD